MYLDKRERTVGIAVGEVYKKRDHICKIIYIEYKRQMQAQNINGLVQNQFGFIILHRERER